MTRPVGMICCARSSRWTARSSSSRRGSAARSCCKSAFIGAPFERCEKEGHALIEKREGLLLLRRSVAQPEGDDARVKGPVEMSPQRRQRRADDALQFGKMFVANAIGLMGTRGSFGRSEDRVDDAGQKRP